MALFPGTRFGPYEATAQIGVGGMGEVYQSTAAAPALALSACRTRSCFLRLR